MNFINLHILTFGHCMYCIWALCLLLIMWHFILHNYNEQVKTWLIRRRVRSPIAIGRGALFALLCFIYFISTMTMFFCFSLTCPCTNDIRNVFLFDFHVKFVLGSLFMWVWFFYTIKLTPLPFALTLLAPREQRPTHWHLYVLWLILPYLHFFSFDYRYWEQ